MTDTNTITPGSPDAPDYDDFAATYAAANDTSLFNAWYTRPEMLRLAGDITGKRVLDAGRGHGPLMVALRDRGALVAGFDLSPAMIGIAQSRLGSDSDVRVADLAERLPYDDDEFDVVTCSLALHYVQDWSPARPAAPCAQARRAAGGRDHPPLRLRVLLPGPGLLRPDPVLRGPRARRRHVHPHLLAPTPAGRHQRLRRCRSRHHHASPSLPPSQNTPADLLPPEGHRFICFLFFALESP